MGKADYVKYQCLTQKSLVAAVGLHHLRHAGPDLQPEPALDHARRDAGHDHGQAHGHQRRQLARHLHGVATIGGGMTATVDAADAVAGAGRERQLHGDDRRRAPPRRKFTWEYGTLTWSERHARRAQPDAGQPRPADLGAGRLLGQHGLGQQDVHDQHRLRRPSRTRTRACKDVTLGSPVTLTPNSERRRRRGLPDGHGPTANVHGLQLQRAGGRHRGALRAAPGRRQRRDGRQRPRGGAAERHRGVLGVRHLARDGGTAEPGRRHVQGLRGLVRQPERARRRTSSRAGSSRRATPPAARSTC